jgi:glycosyltransferase involved in cell wall biosynthesis
MTGIIIVTYNRPDLLPIQLGAIQLFCKDKYEVVVIDNSTDEASADEIAAIAYDCRVYRTSSHSKNSSDSHAFAANFAFTKLRNDYEHFLFLDHDIFPTKPFSVPEMLCDRFLGGLGQIKHKTYLWPGFVFWRNDKVESLDFSTSPGLDTGGNTWKEVERIGIDGIAWQPEVYCENQYFKEPPYNFYSVIGDGWIHFINSSGWNPQKGHNERLDSLKRILNEKINESIASYNSNEQVHQVPAEAPVICRDILPEGA